MFQDSFSTVKQLSQDFKVTADKVVSTVQQQKEQIKELQTQLKQLKQQLWKAHIPSWLAQEHDVKGMPSFFIQTSGYTTQELKEIAADLATHKKGFYCLISSHDDTSALYVTVAPEYKQQVDMAGLKTWLASNLGIRGGGSAHELQGGGNKISSDWKQQVKQWLQGDKQ